MKLCNTQYSIYSIYSVDFWKVEIRSYREVLHNQYEGWWAELPQNRVWKWVAKCIRYLLNVMRIMIFGKGTSLNSTVKSKGLLTTHLKKLSSSVILQSRIMWHNLLLNSPPKSDIFFIHRFGPSPAPCNWPRPVEDRLDMVPRSNMSRLHSFAPPAARLRREGIQCGLIQGCG